MDAQRLEQLQIDPSAKRRPQRMLAVIFIVIALITGATIFLAWPRASDKVRKLSHPAATTSATMTTANATEPAAEAAAWTETNSTSASTPDADTILTVSGYIINRERIELTKI